jgi:HEAT repeat protein
MDLDDWINRIRSADPMTFEDAYFGNRPYGPAVIQRLISELHGSSDAYTRGKFCELLGEMGDDTVVPVLTQELSHPDQVVRQWASQALEELKSASAKAAKSAFLAQFKHGK